MQDFGKEAIFEMEKVARCVSKLVRDYFAKTTADNTYRADRGVVVVKAAARWGRVRRPHL